MKPNLSDKHIISKLLEKNTHDSALLNKQNDILFFNFIFISFFIVCILFLIFRYIDKQKVYNKDIKKIDGLFSL
jgi:hypothetical protein